MLIMFTFHLKYSHCLFPLQVCLHSCQVLILLIFFKTLNFFGTVPPLHIGPVVVVEVVIVVVVVVVVLLVVIDVASPSVVVILVLGGGQVLRSGITLANQSVK